MVEAKKRAPVFDKGRRSDRENELRIPQTTNRKARNRTNRRRGYRGAIEALHDRGAHFVLLDGKAPAGTDWAKWTEGPRPPVDAVVGYAEAVGRDALGLVPWSLGLSGLDLDFGRPADLEREFPALASYPSARGRHVYYLDLEPRPGWPWKCSACGGHVRSAGAYLKLHGDGLLVLAEALAEQPALFELTQPGLFGFPLRCPEHEAELRRRRLAGPERSARPVPLPDLSRVRKGRRNVSVFNHLRQWTYRRPRVGTHASFHEAVRLRAFELNARLPRPLPAAEIRATARSVSGWVWTRPEYRNWDRALQRDRGRRSGEARRAASVERDAAILALRARGLSYRAIGAELGLPKSTIYDAVSRSL